MHMSRVGASRQCCEHRMWVLPLCRAAGLHSPSYSADAHLQGLG